MTIINIYALNTKTSGYVKQLLMDLHGGIDFKIIMLGFLTPHYHQYRNYIESQRRNRANTYHGENEPN